MSVASNLWSLSRFFYARNMVTLARGVKAANFLINSTLLPFQAHVGRGVRLEHHGLGTVIHPNVTIGNDVQIWHGVTIAAETQPGSEHRVYVGDNVVIGANSTIVARGDRSLYIGRDSRLGAGAVVTRDVPPGSTMVGVPARPLVRTTPRGALT